jgi:histidine kinase
VTLIVTADLLATRDVAPELLPTFHAAVNRALLVAAVAATIAGLAASLLLVREIMRPLRALSQSSQRIASGRYDERVRIPSTDELADVAHSFNRMAAELEQVEQQRVILIGNVSHELRTPLAGLEGYLEGLIDGVIPNDAETFSAMQHEVRRLRRLVDDLQTLSRVEAGQVMLHLAPVDLVPLARRVVAQLQPQAEAQGLHIGLETVPGQLVAHADADRVAQILINLVGNAIQYTPEGGRIIVRLASAGGSGTVAVEDTGVGIPADVLPYLFERFYRVDPSRSRSSGGSGIGLTIARHLAWAMGGELTAASDGPGTGSTFTLTLPLLES